MTSAILIPISEYLDTVYHPDCEYIDGELRERNVGKWEHSRLQSLLAGWFLNHETVWSIMISTEQRIRVSSDRVRIPDVVLVHPGPQPEILTDPPLLVVEILSPGDTYSELQQRCQDYRVLGVGTIWIIDPATRSGRMCAGPNWIAAERLEVAGTPIFVELEHLFDQLHKQAPPSR